MASSGRVLVYGGMGALGSTCVNFFKKNNWWVGSIDLKANDSADANIVVDVASGWTDQNTAVLSGVEAALEGNKLDAILCLAGGWAGGNAASADLVKNCDLMWKQSVWSSVIASQVASKHLSEDGMLALVGASACLKGTPGMIGYGMAKAAVHQLVKSLAEKKSGLPQSSTSLAILPVTLDTPMNRKFMPKADHSTWTSMDFIAELFLKWSEKKDRPGNGALLELVTKGGETEILPVKE